MLTVFAYKTNRDYLIFHLERYEIVEVNIGDSFEAIIRRKKMPEIILFHIDLTNYKTFFSDTHDPHEAARRLGIKVINYGLYNISKNAIQQALLNLKLPSTRAVRDETDGDEKLIIKADFNYGARKERERSVAELKQLGINCDFSQVPGFDEYKVVEAKNIAENVWKQDGLIVERFIKNDQETYIRIFKYFNRYVFVRLTVPGKDIKKMSDSRIRLRYFCKKDKIPFILNKEINNALSDADKFFTGLNIDFGAIDMMTDNNGINYIVDFNDTPFWGRPYWGAGNETKLIAYLSKNKISVKYTARKTYNSMRSLVGL